MCDDGLLKYIKNIQPLQIDISLASFPGVAPPVNLRLAEEQFASGRLLIGDLSLANYNYQREKNNYLNMAYNSFPHN